MISAYVSQDPDIPALARRNVYADFCTGQEARADRLVAQAERRTSIGIGPDQRMYFTQNSGELRRIDPLP